MPRRELTVEELIDLEQQADFFTVLGQDEAAIDLLMGHVRSSGGTSPLPYLKLMEIYARQGDRDAYERTRERFNQRFNAYAPGFANEIAGRSLDDYPEVMRQLQSEWADPHAVMETMDALVFRRGGDAVTFDLPAYRELLFLYSIARDLAQMPATPTPVWKHAEDTLPLLTNVPDAYQETHQPTHQGGRQPALSVIDIDLSEPLPPPDFAGLIGTGRRPDGA
jgi:hypothetical protein